MTIEEFQKVGTYDEFKVVGDTNGLPFRRGTRVTLMGFGDRNYEGNVVSGYFRGWANKYKLDHQEHWEIPCENVEKLTI